MALRVHHLDCGTMCPWSLLTGVDHLVCHVLLVEGPLGLVLVDTGFGLADVADPRRLGPTRLLLRARFDPEQTAARRIEQLGFAAGDVRDIVLTHLDYDHAGGIGDFPAATVHVSRTAHDAAVTSPTPTERRRYRAAQWAHGPRWNLVDTDAGGDAWFGFAAARELAGLGGDVALVPLGGHVRGHCGVAVRTDDGWLLHAGDAYFHGADVPQRRAPTSTGGRVPRGLARYERTASLDWKERCANLERLRELARAHGDAVRIVPAHDAAELDAVARRP